MGKRTILAAAVVLAILGTSGEKTASGVNFNNFTYDAEGKVTSVTSPQGVIAYEYSSITGQMTFMRTPADGSDTEIEYRYDGMGRLSRVIVHRRNGVSVDEHYVYTYNAVGSLETLCRHNGNCSFYNYDTLNRLNELVNKDSSGNILSRFVYQINDDGTRHSVTETFAGQDTIITWSYDNLNRMTREVYDAPGTADDYTEDYRYDVVGNRVRKDRNGVPQVYYFYDVRDQLTKETSDAAGNNILAEYQYDDNGSLTQMTAGANVTTYGYNLRNQMVSVDNGTSVINYEYDPEGKRVKKEVVGGATTNYLIDSHNHTGYPQVVKETAGSTNISYVIGHAILTQNVGTNSPQHMLHDGHGSVRQITNSAETVTSNYHYDAYGKMLPRSDTPETKILYVGQMWDSDLGFYDNWHRWYDPQTGRFNQVDTYAGNNYDPISLHKYLYAHANPINGIDPTGLSWFFAGLGNAVHREIENMYRYEHIGKISLGASIPGLAGALMPDIMDFQLKEIGEIKPLSASGLTTGPIQLGAYLYASNKLGVLGAPDKPWTPSTWPVGVRQVFVPAYPNYIVVTVGNAGGLIFYTAMKKPNGNFGTKLAPATLKWLKGQCEDIIDELKRNTQGNYAALGGVISYLDYRAGVALNSAVAQNMVRVAVPTISAMIIADIGCRVMLSMQTYRMAGI